MTAHVHVLCTNMIRSNGKAKHTIMQLGTHGESFPTPVTRAFVDLRTTSARSSPSSNK